ncbi:MAG: hypothetical protein M3R66_01400 [Actinomycetota bacterium]|nr:hypothetical protein [Actinomycetota bacterium]
MCDGGEHGPERHSQPADPPPPPQARRPPEWHRPATATGKGQAPSTPRVAIILQAVLQEHLDALERTIPSAEAAKRAVEHALACPEENFRDCLEIRFQITSRSRHP